MNSGTPTRRIIFAIALSVLLHSAILWLFQIELPNSEVLLPPLNAQLQAVPLQADVPKPEVESANPPAETDHTVTTPSEPASIPVADAASAVATTPEPESIPAVEATSAVAVTPEPESIPATEPASAVAAISEPASIPTIEGASAVAKVDEPVTHPLPKHAQLKFVVYYGQDDFKIGEISHQLEIIEDKYVLKAETKSTGLARLFKSYQLIQTSHGKAGNFGLQPEGYEEEQNVSSGKQKMDVVFNWTENKLHFSHGGETGLPPDAQDILSFLYQLSQRPLHDKILSIAITTSKKLEKYELEIGAEEEVITPMGKLRALALRRLHSQDGDGMEVWLGLEYRLLPIKFRQIKRSGGMILEVVISDIRVADE